MPLMKVCRRKQNNTNQLLGVTRLTGLFSDHLSVTMFNIINGAPPPGMHNTRCSLPCYTQFDSIRPITTATGSFLRQPSIILGHQGDTAQQYVLMSQIRDSELRELIKKGKEPAFREMDADNLNLWNVHVHCCYENCC